MATYYIEREGQIKLFDTDRNKLVNSLKFMPQYKAEDIKETERPIENFEWADTPEYIAKKARKELESRVAGLEATTGLIRPMREMVLAEGSGASEYVIGKAQEIEDLAAQLRG